MIKKALLMLSFLHLMTISHCQDRYSSLFYSDFSDLNPAYVGMLEKNQATFSTSEFNSKDFDFNYSSGRVALSIPISKIYSGIGFHSSYSKIGLESDLDIGFIYSFKYAITDKIKVSLGSNLSILRNKIKGTFWIYDPYNENSEYINEEAYLFNVDVGIWLEVYGFQLGITNKHINEPSHNIHFLNETINQKLYSSMNVIINHDFHVAQKHTLRNSFLVYDLMNFSESKYFVLNNQFVFNNKFIVGLTTQLYKTDEINAYLFPNLGFNLSDKFDMIMSMDLIKIKKPNVSIGNTIEAILNFKF